MPARELIQRRYPYVALLILTSAAPAEILPAVETGLRDGYNPSLSLMGSTAGVIKLSYRHSSLRVSPRIGIVVRVVPSAGGTNLHVRVGAGKLWPGLQISFAAVTVAGLITSFAWREFIAAPWILLAILMSSFTHMWDVADSVAAFLTRALPE